MLALHREAERVAAIGSFEYRPPEGATIWSDQLFRVYAMDPERDEPLAGEAFDSRVHPGDQGALADFYRDMQAGGEYSADLRFNRFDGVERILHLRGVSVLDESGALTKANGTAQDVTESRMTERMLRDSERRLVEAQRVAGFGSFDGSVETGEYEWSEELYRLYGLDPSQRPWTAEEMLARLTPVGPDPPTAEGLTVPGKFTHEFRLTRPDGVVRQYEVHAEYYLADRTRRVRGTSRDVTAIRRAEAQQASVARLSQRGLEGLEVPELLDLACSELAGALGADAAAVLEIQPDGSSLRLVAAHGLPDGAVGTTVPPGTSTAERALADDRPVLVEDWRKERNFVPPAPMGHMEIRSAIAVPIRTRDGPFGTLGAAALTADRFAQDTVDFIVALANVVAAAIERRSGEEQIASLAALRGRLVAQTVDAEERVRRRVSEAIHDGALQNLLASRQDLVEAAEAPGGNPELVDRARQGIERAVEELREAVQALHPLVLAHGGLAAALGASADYAARNGGFTPRVSVDRRAGGLRDELLLSLARELLTNAAKHAGASEVAVTVSMSPGEVALQVSDDGCGIPEGSLAAAPKEGHIGLASVAERVEAVGGRLEFPSPGPPGTTVRVALPVPID